MHGIIQPVLSSNCVCCLCLSAQQLSERTVYTTGLCLQTVCVLFIYLLIHLFYRVITPHEAKSLVALLHSSDELLLERTLTTICNCGTFSANQVI